VDTNDGMLTYFNTNQENHNNSTQYSFFWYKKSTRPNINALIEKWMLCDLLWAFRCPNSKYVLRLKGNEKYHYEEIVSKEFWLELLILDPHEKKLSWK